MFCISLFVKMNKVTASELKLYYGKKQLPYDEYRDV
jgi:hypothetical protein